MSRFIRPPRNRTEAWRCLLMNLLAFPGLGTILAGRKVGFAQATLMLVGFFAVVGYLCWAIFHQIKLLFDMGATAQEFREQRFEHWWVGAVGFGICLLAWVWSLITSIQLVKGAPEETPMAPPRIQ